MGSLMVHYFPSNGRMRYGINQKTVAKRKKRTSIATLPQIQQVLALISDTGMKGRVELDSFFFANLQKVVAEDPAQAVGYLVGSMTSATISDAAPLKMGNNIVAISVGYSSVTEALMGETRSNDLKVETWAVGTSA
jgi:hypothetical protein